jgi:hypothetical protein
MNQVFELYQNPKIVLNGLSLESVSKCEGYDCEKICRSCIVAIKKEITTQNVRMK